MDKRLKRRYYKLSEEQSKNLDARIEAYKRNPKNVLTWEEIKNKLLKK